MSEAVSVLLQEVGNEIRSRRDPEHTYTAAALGAFAAIVGGVAAVTALANVSAVPFWRHPALIGAAVCAVLAFLVIRKIERESGIYADLRQAQFKLVELLAASAGLKADDIPPGLKATAPKPEGHHYSSQLIGGTAAASFVFCTAVWYGTITSAASLTPAGPTIVNCPNPAASAPRQ